jgi:phosphoglycolate phosphatase-like HAD superfamily hydrolase
VRYSTVPFDLDGTLIDSAAIILALMRHATRTVLGREIPDDQLLAGVGSMRSCSRAPGSSTCCQRCAPRDAGWGS